MSLLITADLHLSDSLKDSYRWNIFPWLLNQQQKYHVDATLVLGDLTTSKDRHPSGLVNNLVGAFTSLIPPVYVLKGNHDFVDENMPFFQFIGHIHGLEFVNRPWVMTAGSDTVIAMIPHQPNQKAFDIAISTIAPKVTGVMLHQTVEGAIAESGSRLSGLRASAIEPLGARWCYSGDIHKPQQCGPVTYVGSPYHTRFGDGFKPRVVLVQGNVHRNLYFPAPRKWVLHVTSPDDIQNNEELREGDHVKITLTLTREEVVEWHAHRQAVIAMCMKLGLEVYGIDLKVASNSRRERVRLDDEPAKTVEGIFDGFCKAENIASNIKKAGRQLLGTQ